MTRPATKLSRVKALMRDGDHAAAILLAAKFGRLGSERAAILGAREALLRPEFQRAIGRDPAALIAAGVAAIEARWGGR